MKDNRKPTNDAQRRIDVCENVINWANEDQQHRGCIVLATDEESSTYAVIGRGQNIIMALTSAIKSTPNLRGILSTALMFDTITGGSKSDTDKD